MPKPPLVSVLFITFKRVHLLRRTLDSFIANTSYRNLELIVTDDGSPTWMQEEISRLPFHKHIFATKRQGMGANANQGMRQCSGDYILFLQDDWECHGPLEYLEEAVQSMRKFPKIGIVRFSAVDEKLNSSVELSNGSRRFCSLNSPRLVNELNRNLYSDTPHLKSKAFVEFMGPYQEGTAMEECEREFQNRFLEQTAFEVGFFPDFNNLTFRHIGEKESLRTKTFRFRFEKKISALPFKGTIAFRSAKFLYKRTISLLFRMRVLK